MREFISKILSVRVYSHYGHAEHLLLGGECEYSTDYHLFPSYGIVEIRSEDGTNITLPGIQGELIGTTLINFSMPLIRYRTGDYAEWSKRECVCRRNWLHIRNVIGKFQMVAVFDQKGNAYNLTQLMRTTDFLYDIYPFGYFYKYQFIQKKRGEVILKIVPRPTYKIEIGQLIQKGFNSITNGKISVTIQVVDTISLEPSGKQKLLIQMLDNSDNAIKIKL